MPPNDDDDCESSVAPAKAAVFDFVLYLRLLLPQMLTLDVLVVQLVEARCDLGVV